MAMQCKLQKKNKKDCPNKGEDLFNCWSSECQGWIHKGCCELMCNQYSIKPDDRPSAEERTESDEPVVFCTKTCYQKWKVPQNKKKREEAKAAKASKVRKRKVPWEEDGSMEVLMEWITTEGNYSNCCGGAGTKGTSKKQFHKEISLLISEKLPESEGRSSKDVENKIHSLENQFRTATDWLNNTGQGVDNPGDIEKAVLLRCPLYKELEPIMGARPNSKPLATNEDSDEESEGNNSNNSFPVSSPKDDDSNLSGVADDKAVQDINNPTDLTGETPLPKSFSGKDKDKISTGAKGTNSKRISVAAGVKSEKPKRAKKGSGADDTIVQYLKGTNLESLREREVEAKEKEATARETEAAARTAKRRLA